MFDKVSEAIMRGVNSSIHNTYGGVGYYIYYDDEVKVFGLEIYDKSLKCKDKKLVHVYEFPYNLEDSTKAEYTLVDEIVSQIEEWVYNQLEAGV